MINNLDKHCQHHFTKGPKVAATFHSFEGQLLKVLLAYHDGEGMQCRVVGGKEQEIFSWVESYLAKKPHLFPLTLDLDDFRPFTQSVLMTLLTIPFGTVLTYGEVAKKVRQERAARAVGSACGVNPFPLVIPCHRVVAAGSALGGFSLDPRIKKELLLYEGQLASLSHECN